MIEPTRLFVLRHGQTDWNAALRIQGHTDIPLNATGRRQAAALAAALADDGIAAVYSSDLQRALQTAEALAAATGLGVTTDAGLRERAFGSFEGSTFADIEQRLPDDARRWRQRHIDFAPGGGETLTALSERSVATACRLAAAHPGQTIALVAHGGVLDCLYRAALGIELQARRNWQLGNASINRLLFGGDRLTLVGWNDDAHLQQAVDEPPGLAPSPPRRGLG